MVHELCELLRHGPLQRVGDQPVRRSGRLRLLREQIQQVYGRQDRQVRFPRERRHRADGLRGGIARHDDLRADLLEHAGLRRRPGQGRDLQQQQVEPAAQRITPGGSRRRHAPRQDAGTTPKKNLPGFPGGFCTHKH